MGIMIYSLLWVMQDICHQPYLTPKDPTILSLRAPCIPLEPKIIFPSPQFYNGTPAKSIEGDLETLKPGPYISPQQQNRPKALQNRVFAPKSLKI